jgi:hypothetical protein
MNGSSMGKWVVVILLAAGGMFILTRLFEEITPRASVDLRFSRTEIMDSSRAYLEKLGYDVRTLHQDAFFQFDDPTHIYLQSKRGMAGANRAIRNGEIEAHEWRVVWFDRTVPKSQNKETFEVTVGQGGRIDGFDHSLKDTVTLPSLSKDSARMLAESFLTKQGLDLSSYALKTSSDIALANRVDHRFVWKREDTVGDFTVWVRVQGTEVGGFNRSFSPPGSFIGTFSQVATTWTFVVTASFAATFLLLFFIVFLFLKKYHEGEVGITTAFMVFLGLFAVNLLRAVNELPVTAFGTQIGDMNGYNVRIVIFVIRILMINMFVGVMVFAAWSVGESSSRSVWPQKMRAMDAALARRFFTEDIGLGILRGYGWGVAMLAVYGVVLALLVRIPNEYLFTGNLAAVPEAYIPGLEPALLGIVFGVQSEVILRLFFLSYLKEKTKRTWPGVLVSAAVWAAVAQTIWELPLGQPGPFGTMLILCLFGLAFSFLFLRYDLLTSMTASAVICGVNAAIPLFVSTGASFAPMRWTVLVLFALPLAIAVVALIRRERFEFTPEMMPKHIKRISERERMAKELEIARNVQMSLLPKSNPQVAGYDIAGSCIPALEVGGDYYDFVHLPGGKIGIAIGDVSGKGVPAAIYMTLTKGILQSNAEENTSPKDVLRKVNSLMFRTVERNTFVSMFYAVLDLTTRTLRFARAGQCPLILAQDASGAGSFMTPRGLALGLEMGKVFDATLEEQEIHLSQGDILVFYTDGFTEAMTATGEEYGEDRLMESVRRHRAGSAAEIIRAIGDDLRRHTSSVPQHDDMTMVVVKVL